MFVGHLYLPSSKAKIQFLKYQHEKENYLKYTADLQKTKVYNWQKSVIIEFKKYIIKSKENLIKYRFESKSY